MGLHTADSRANVYEDLSEKIKEVYWKKQNGRKIMVNQRGNKREEI